MEEPKQKTKRRLCFICRRELTVRHYIKEEWLEDLKKHCINLEMLEKISPGKFVVLISKNTPTRQVLPMQADIIHLSSEQSFVDQDTSQKAILHLALQKNPRFVRKGPTR